MKKKYFSFGIIAIFLLTQMNSFGLKDAFNPKAVDNPYMMDDPNSFKIVPGSITKDGFVFEVTIYDNAASTFTNNFYSDTTEAVLVGMPESGTTFFINSIPLTFESDEESGIFKYSAIVSEQDGIDNGIICEVLINWHIALDAPTNSIEDIYLDDRGINSEGAVTFKKDTSTYPIIQTNTTSLGESFKIDEVNNDSILFTLNMDANGTTIPSTLEVSLRNSTDQNTADGKPYTANLVSSDSVNGIYQYEIDNLAPDTYYFRALDNTNLTIDSGTGSTIYTPDNAVMLVDDLGYSESTDLSFTISEDPYLTTNPFAIDQSSATKTSIQFSITVADSYDGKFYTNMSTNSQIEVTLLDLDNSSTPINTTATWINNFTSPRAEPTDGVYIFEIDNLTPGTNYQIYSLDNTGLALSSTTAADPEIIIQDDLEITDNSFTTLANPYIADQSFVITEATKTSVKFKISVINDTTNSFIPESVLNVTIKDEAGTSHQTTANYVETSSTEQNTYIYEITELESGVAFSPNTNYTIYSINNSGLAVENDSATIDNEILIADDLNSDGSFNIVENAYITDQSFNVTERTKTSMQFQINVVNNSENEFIPENALDVTLKDSADVSYQTTANYISTDGSGNYTYEITELSSGINFTPGTDYSVYSINNTGLAVGSSISDIDDEILIEDDLNSDGSFSTIGNAYITDQSFNVIETTKTSMQFQINVVNNSENEFIPENALDVTLKDSADVSYQTTANYVSTNGSGNYTYEILDLGGGVNFTPGTDYSVYSINNTRLAVGNSSSDIDDEILIENDLNSDGSFSTIGNAYIEDESFNITEATKTSMQFQINVVNNELSEFNSENDLDVTLKDSADVSYQTTANYVSTDGSGNYTYEITELSDGVAFMPGTNYSVYSINNTGLAVGNSSSDIDDEILIENDLNSDGSFSTIGNAYIEDESFNITEATKTSMQFQINVVNNELSEFNSENDLDVTLKDSADVSYQTTANYVSTDGSGNYTYEITELSDGVAFMPGTNYSVYSINNTGLAVGNSSSDIDDEILIENDLNSDGSFSTIGNAYIEDESFEIIGNDESSVTFQINIDDVDGSYDSKNPLSVTLRNETDSKNENYNASLISNDATLYTYKINGLTINKAYSFVSFNDVNLAIDDDSSEIHEDINIITDLGATKEGASFNTFVTAYISSTDGFKIETDSINETSIQYTIKVDNWSDNYDRTIDVKLFNNETEMYEVYTSTYVSNSGNNYTYEIDNLAAGSSYSFYSILDSNLAVGSEAAAIDDEIIISTELGIDSESLLFETTEVVQSSSSLFFVIIILIIIMIIISVLVIVYLKMRKNKKEKTGGEKIKYKGKSSHKGSLFDELD